MTLYLYSNTGKQNRWEWWCWILTDHFIDLWESVDWHLRNTFYFRLLDHCQECGIIVKWNGSFFLFRSLENGVVILDQETLSHKAIFEVSQQLWWLEVIHLWANVWGALKEIKHVVSNYDFNQVWVTIDLSEQDVSIKYIEILGCSISLFRECALTCAPSRKKPIWRPNSFQEDFVA